MNSTIKINGLTISYTEMGQGEKTVLFVHGNSSSSQVFYKQLHSELNETNRLIAIDLPGMGDSAHDLNAKTNPEIYALDYYAKFLKDFVTELKLNKVFVVGHSLGGHIGIRLANICKLSGLFIFGTPPLEVPSDLGLAFQQVPDSACLFKGDATDEEIQAMINFFEVQDTTVDFFKNYRKSDPQFRNNLIANLVSLPIVGEMTILKELSIPVYIAFNKNDRLFNYDFIRNRKLELQERKNVFFIDIGEVGHYDQLDYSRKFNSTLLEVLN